MYKSELSRKQRQCALKCRRSTNRKAAERIKLVTVLWKLFPTLLHSVSVCFCGMARSQVAGRDKNPVFAACLLFLLQKFQYYNTEFISFLAKLNWKVWLLNFKLLTLWKSAIKINFLLWLFLPYWFQCFYHLRKSVRAFPFHHKSEKVSGSLKMYQSSLSKLEKTFKIEAGFAFISFFVLFITTNYFRKVVSLELAALHFSA